MAGPIPGFARATKSKLNRESRECDLESVDRQSRAASRQVLLVRVRCESGHTMTTPFSPSDGMVFICVFNS